MRYVKQGVEFKGCQPELVEAIITAALVYAQWGYEVVVTSGSDSHDHKPLSLHHQGYACDLRTRHLKVNDRGPLVAELRGELGYHYDVVLEADHLHIEYQPKDARGKAWPIVGGRYQAPAGDRGVV